MALALPLLLGLLVPFLTASPALAANSADTCSYVVEESTCNAEVRRECADSKPDRQDACEEAIVHQAKYHGVYTVCRDRQNPQACHKKINEKCAGKTGDDLKRCKESTAGKLPPKKSAAAQVNEVASLAGKGEKEFQCGTGDDAVGTRFDFGCVGKEYEAEGREIGTIEDLAYAILRFLSIGVGLVLVASIIYAGIQYSSSEGSPEATQAAKKRIQNAIIGLVFYLFIFAFVQYLVPGGLFVP